MLKKDSDWMGKTITAASLITGREDNITIAAAAEISVFLYIMIDSIRDTKGTPASIRRITLNHVADFFQSALSKACSISYEDAGPIFDSRQYSFSKILNKHMGITEGFLKDSLDYLVDIVSWLIENHTPSRAVPDPQSPSEYAPVCLDILLKHKVHIVLSESIINRLPEILKSQEI